MICMKYVNDLCHYFTEKFLRIFEQALNLQNEQVQDTGLQESIAERAFPVVHVGNNTSNQNACDVQNGINMYQLCPELESVTQK